MRGRHEGDGRRRLVRRAAVTACLVGLAALVAGVLYAWLAAVPSNSGRPGHPSTAATPIWDPNSGDAQRLAQAKSIATPARPSRLTVPSIGVDASVEPVGLDDQGRMAAPAKTTDVGWYQLGATPGDAGDAVIDGHLDWTGGPAVFWRLYQLRPGDTVLVARADGSQAKFVVDSTTMVPFDASTDGLYSRAGMPSLTLITCAGAWDRLRGTYLQRVLVHSTLVSSQLAEKPSPGQS